MASSRYLISSQTLSSSAASVTFSSIPATYTDLVLRISARTSDTSVPPSGDVLTYRFNSTGSSYSGTELRGYGTTTASGRWSAQTYQYTGLPGMDSNGNTANTYTSFEIYIPSYTSSSNKVSSAFTAAEDNSAGSNDLAATAQLWSNTAAITSISFTTSNASNFLSTSSFYLYGIKNSQGQLWQ